jgi:hypothetical protein
MRSRAAGVQPAFPPNVIVEVKRIACERPVDAGVPLARWSLTDLHREVLARGLVATISDTTLWRWLDADAIRPWRYRSWVFPRDPQFAERAGPVLDLYARHWENRPLGPRDYVISADEKTSIQARHRRHRSTPVAPGRARRVEHEYERRGAWAYLAAWDVHRARLFGRCEARNGIAAFDRLVEQVMTQEPYRSARRVFWVTDNGSAHRGAKGDARLQECWPNLIQLDRARTLSARVSSALPNDRDAVPLDLHSGGFASVIDSARRQRRRGAAGRLRRRIRHRNCETLDLVQSSKFKVRTACR